ncbi:MAG TPA: ATP-binding protein [Verrucomicrobiota bacterium]|nr:ATP-binding protein [Verrucomicrobiota bacterium]
MQTLIPIQATDGQPTLPGFRLKRLEVLNWGTFHGKIDRLIADCRWTLISGSNGSGKSTAADALRTLLVPPSKLTYNDASVDQKLRNTRKDRTKKTYIRGAYGASSQEDSATAILQFHRSEGEQSSILAVFANEYTGAVVTLAQILWMQNDETYQHYLVARQERTIKEHLTNLGEGRQFKRQLQTHGFEVFNSFSAYEVKFRSYLGIPGASALEVFNQVIGVKEVHDLNTFIRKHLLEPTRTGDYIQAHLKPHFTQLSACWEAIQKAGAQLELLKPIVENHAKLIEAEKAKAELEAIQALLRRASVPSPAGGGWLPVSGVPASGARTRCVASPTRFFAALEVPERRGSVCGPPPRVERAILAMAVCWSRTTFEVLRCCSDGIL